MGAFHDDVRALLQSRDWRVADAQRAAAMSKDGLGQCLRKSSYPHPPALERLIQALDVAEEMANAWRAERAAHRAYADLEDYRCRGCRNVRQRPRGSGRIYCGK